VRFGRKKSGGRYFCVTSAFDFLRNL